MLLQQHFSKHTMKIFVHAGKQEMGKKGWGLLVLSTHGCYFKDEDL